MVDIYDTTTGKRAQLRATAGVLQTSTASATTDSTGKATVQPDAWGHAYGYNASGQLTTDTTTDPVSGAVYVKTYTWAGSQLTSETAWVRQ